MESKGAMRYVSSAGIVLVSEKDSIAIDCFCKDPGKQYPDTPPEVRGELLQEIGVGKLNSLIFTHEHGDHFCPEDVKEAWKRNPNIQIYAGDKVTEILSRTGISQSNLIKIKAPERRTLGNFQIDFLDSLHEGEQYADVANLTLLIKIEEKRVVVTGDAAPCEALFQRIATWSGEIDWLFAPFPYVGLRSNRRMLEKYLDIANIFVLHQPRKEADVQNWVDSAKRVCENAKDKLPGPIFPEALGEWYVL